MLSDLTSLRSDPDRDRDREFDPDRDLEFDPDAPDALEAGLVTGEVTGEATGTRRRGSIVGNRWFRWLHVYTSMVSLAVVLFFGVTGLTLNHPEWTFGDGVDRASYSGTLPADYRTGDVVDFLVVSEFVRDEHDVSGQVGEHRIDGSEGTIAYRAPGYAADLTFDVDSGAYTLAVEQQGFVGVINDLHKGRDAPGAWKWVIDASAIMLVLVALTGFGIQLLQRRRRVRAVLFATLGLALTAVLVFVAIA
jgi:hypothetical protein